MRGLRPFSLDDVAALLVIVGCLALIGSGRDSDIKTILGVAAGWLFGKRVGGTSGKGQD